MNSPRETDRRTSKPPTERIVLGVLGVLIVGALFFVLSNQQQVLRSSPAGLDGLRTWLVAQGHSVQNFSGGWSLDGDELGLIIVPLYDTELDVERREPRTQDELLMQQDEYDLAVAPILTKASRVTTMVVLPKWRSGMRLTGRAHPFLFVRPQRVASSLNALIVGSGARIMRDSAPFADFDYIAENETMLSAVTYASQMFTAPGCRPILGSADAMILGECLIEEGRTGRRVLVLSDPDLINNHGLRLGDNAAIMSDLVGLVSGGQQVIIDYSSRSWLANDKQAVARDRTWSDLLRFFSPPFTLIWAGLFIALLLILWRSAVRFGPLCASSNALGASKMTAMSARARLMRLSNQDGALIHDYSKARLAATAAALFGSANARHYASAEAFLAYTQRRHPTLSGRLVTVLKTLRSMPANATAPRAMAAVEELESILEQITNDTQRIKRPS